MRLPTRHKLFHQRHEPSIVSTFQQVDHFMHHDVLQTFARLLGQLRVEANGPRQRATTTPLRLHPLHVKIRDIGNTSPRRNHQKTHSGPYQQQIPLIETLRDLAHHVVNNELSLPRQIKLTFEPYLLCQFPGTSFYTPIYALDVTLEPWRIAVGYEIDIPPKVVTYRYSDIKGERVHDFRPRDIPKVK